MRGADKKSGDARSRQLVVQVERTCGDRSAVGSVTIKKSRSTEGASQSHLGLAAARAWHRLGEEMLSNGETDLAISSAEKGLDELGEDYVSPGTDDDTGQKIAAARDLLRQGRQEDGARLLLRMLKARKALYAEQHRGDLFE